MALYDGLNINTADYNVSGKSASTTTSNSATQGSKYNEYAQMISKIGGSLENILTMKSKAEAEILQIKASIQSSNNSVTAAYYQDQLNQMNQVMTLIMNKIAEEKKKSNTTLYVVAGVSAVAILGLVAYVAFKK